MTDKSGHNEPYKNDREDFFEQFTKDEKDRVRKIWNISSNTARTGPDISENETEHALSNVHRRLGITGNFPVGKSRLLDRNYSWKVIAAAVLLLIFGATILFTPQTTTVPYGKITTVTLPDGSTVELNSGSELRYSRFFSYADRRIRLNGEAFFSVRDDNQPFIVNANGTTIQVTGTKFNVRSWKEDPGTETEVAVAEGTVQFYPEGRRDRSVTIIPGQLSRWTAPMNAPSPPGPATIDRIVGWRDHKLMFNNKSLLVILRELERRFDVNIQLENAGIGNEKLTTYYASPQDIESVLKDICRVKGLRYAETANGFRVYK